MNGLSIRDLHKSFGGHHVVRGLELSLERGEIVSLLGPSGCGKTTALRIVAGLEHADRGEVSIGDRLVFGSGVDLPPEKRGVGMVFQSYAVWPHRTVLENVAYPLELKKQRDARDKAREALSLVRLEALADRFPHTLSGGQQQRIALARALVAQPELLLFDEPLSNLDAKLREEMRHEVRELARRTEITSLYVTHDQPEAFAVSDRVAVVLEGRVAQIAEPHVLYHLPVSREVAAFVGRLSVIEGVAKIAPDRARLPGGVEVAATFATEDTAELIAGIRPEDVALAVPGTLHAIEARITRATFLGDRTELVLETEQGVLRADVESTPRAGELVNLSIRRCRVFAAKALGT